MKNVQQTLLETGQQLKRLKDGGLKAFKKDRKVLENELNETEKRYKQLKPKHQNMLKTLENKNSYWTSVGELSLKIRTKNNYINNLMLITPDSDTLRDKNIEAMLKHLKVSTLLIGHSSGNK